MDRYFVCLANSYKHGGRCLAGIEVEWVEGHWRIVRNKKGCPKWIRPLSKETNTGEIPNEQALFAVLEIIKIEGAEECPQDAQTENVYYEKMIPLGKQYKKSSVLLERFIDESHSHILYNYGKAVSPDVFCNRGTYSILLIRTFDSEIYIETGIKDFPRYRIKFSYRGHCYDFPITDPGYLHEMRLGKRTIGYKGTMFITCSLGVEHEGWHPKLAACVFEIDTENDKKDLEQNVIETVDEDWFSNCENELRLLLEQKNIIDEKIKELRAMITQNMESRRLKIVESSMFTIKYIPPKVVMQFDSKAFKDDYEELYNSYCKPKQKKASIVVKKIEDLD